ncbi:MAG: hypothetical protein R6Y91_09045, partial [Desulfohalobium sp.]
MRKQFDTDEIFKLGIILADRVLQVWSLKISYVNKKFVLFRKMVRSMSQVLIYTENTFFGKFIKSLLEILSLKNDIVNTKHQIIQKLENIEYCLLVSDFCSKNFFSIARKKSRNSNIPIVYISNDYILSDKNNITVCLTRPLDMQNFIHVIENLLNKGNNFYFLS